MANNGGGGVYFAGEGNQDLLSDSYNTTPAQPGSQGGGNKFEFADGGNGDDVNTTIGVDLNKMVNRDPVNHDYSGPGFTPIHDNEWTGNNLSGTK